MSNYLRFLTVFILGTFFSCKVPEINELTLVIPPESSESREASSMVKEVQFSPLSGEQGLIPFEADRIDFADEFFAVGDFTFSQSVFVFEKATGKTLEIPLKKGEGPLEVLAVNDFWIDANVIYALDGIGRKIIPISFSAGIFQQLEPIRLEIPIRRFAKTKMGFVGLTGGGQEYALAFLDESGKLISSHLPNSIEFLMSPPNPFHKVKAENEEQIFFHTSFSPEILRVDNGFPEPFKKMVYEGKLVEKPVNTDFVLDINGFNQFRESLRNQPSQFTGFEITNDDFILVYFIQNSPRLALSSKGAGSSLRIENLKNDLSFDNQPFPKVVGVHESRFVALVNTDQLNQDDPEFSESDLAKAMKAHPEAQVFLLEFDLK